MTSAVVWHRYADKQPEEGARCLVLTKRMRGAGGRRFAVTARAVSVWKGENGVTRCRPDDLWCLLPTPPKEES